VADLFSPLTLKGVTLRNRIGMSPMTMHASVDGAMNDYHVMYLGARAAGGFGLVFPEQIAIVPEGRTTVDCAGIWTDDQIEGHRRVTGIIRRQGGVAGIQLGHTGRKGSEVAAHGQVGEYGPARSSRRTTSGAGRSAARRTSRTAATTPSTCTR
jgi:2,4-dienoyl-CoA reductase-like NADH-dependent reductase (Old Yellow Enzyme family)